MQLTGAKFISIKNAILLGVSFFPFALFIGMFEFALPLKLNDIQTTVFLIGVFISFSWIITTFLDLIWGSVIDRIGKWKSILIGYVIFGIASLCFAFSNDIWVLFILNLIAYLGFDILYISIEGFLIDTSSKKYFNYSTSGFFPIWSAAYVAGPPLAAIVLMEFGFSAAYLFAIPLCAISIILFWLFFHKKFKKAKVQKNKSTSLFKDIPYFVKMFKSNSFVLFGIFICTFWHATMLVGIPLFFGVVEGNLWDAALVATAFAFPFIFTDLIDGFIATNRHRRFEIIVGGFLVGSLSLVGFFITNDLIFAMIAAFVSTIGVNLAWATFEIEAGLISQKNTSGKVESLFVFAKNLGWDTAPIIFGIIAAVFSTKAPFLAVACLLFCIAVLFVIKRDQIK